MIEFSALKETLCTSYVVKILVAAILGGLIGWEREKHGRPAGFRTHILVCIGSTLIMLVSEYIFEKYRLYTRAFPIQIDPARIAAQVVTGIGFLGAGAIMKFRASVRGLTTAACLWVVSAVGLAVGCGYMLPAIFATAVTMATLLILTRIEKRIKRDIYKTVKVWITGSKSRLDGIQNILEKYSANLVSYKFERNIAEDEIMFDINIRFESERIIPRISDEIAEIEGVYKLSLE